MRKARNRPSEQSSQTQRSDLLRTLIVPKLIALNYKNVPTTAQVVKQIAFAVQRLNQTKIMAYRPQQRPSQPIRTVSRMQMYPGYKALWRNKDNTVVKKKLCKRRSDRREQLFRMRIAGPGRRRSPGQGGRYERNNESRISC